MAKREAKDELLESVMRLRELHKDMVKTRKKIEKDGKEIEKLLAIIKR